MLSNVENKDCMLAMAEFPDKFFDLAVVDPPYGINVNKMSGWGTLKNNKNWDINTPDAEYFNLLFNKSKEQIIWGGNYFIDKLFPTPCFLSWDKMNGTNDMADFELAWTSFLTPTRRFSMHHFSKGYGNKIHPTQKPVALYDWIFKNYAKEGMKILDTHLGSGSSRISAYKAGLDFWGYELDKDYFDAQEKRFNNFIAQQDLFRQQ